MIPQGKQVRTEDRRGIVYETMQINHTTSAPLDTSGEKVDVQSADFVTFRRRVPTTMGKWRLLPPEVERARRGP